MNSTLRRSSFRYLLQHPWLMGLSVLGVALGVAVVVAIDLANTSADRAFELSAETVAGKATHQVVGAAGSVDEDVYRRLRTEAGYRQSAPVVQGYVTLAERDRTFQLLGVDPFAEGPFRPYVGSPGSLDLSTFVAQPRTALMAAPTANELGFAPGDSLQISIEGVQYQLQLIGLMEPDNERSRQAISNLIVVDIATAQNLLQMQGSLSRIDLIVPSEEGEGATLERLRAALPPRFSAERSKTRRASSSRSASGSMSRTTTTPTCSFPSMPTRWRTNTPSSCAARRFTRFRRRLRTSRRAPSRRASAIEAGADVRTALTTFGVDASHGWERIHMRSPSAAQC